MHSTSRFTQHHMYYTQKHLRQTKWAQRKGETLWEFTLPEDSTAKVPLEPQVETRESWHYCCKKHSCYPWATHFHPPAGTKVGNQPQLKFGKKKKGGGEFSFNPHQSLDWVYHTKSSANKGGKNCQKENCFLSRSASLPHVKLLLEELYKRSTGMIQYLDDFVLNLTCRTLCTLNLRT